jgi:Concanavalin A-like lectin/glucanases superfamily
MRLCALACALSLFAAPAESARGFGSTLGVGATDSIQTGYSSALPTQHSFFCWVRQNGIGGANAGNIFNQNETTKFWNVGTGFLEWQEGFSSTNGQWYWTDPSTGTLRAYGVSYDGSSTSNKPNLYVNGVLQSVSTLTGPAGSYTGAASTLYVGNRADGALNYDGVLAECTFWSGILTASEFIALSSGAEPLSVRPSAIIISLPLWGNASGERDLGPSHFNQTLTGTKGQPHPPVILNGPEFRTR